MTTQQIIEQRDERAELILRVRQIAGLIRGSTDSSINLWLVSEKRKPARRCNVCGFVHGASRIAI